MTSKKALNDLRERITRPEYFGKSEMLNELTIIEKDLEVLNIFIELFDTEIIKLKKWCILDDVYQFKLQFKEEEFNITERQYKVIKEWLRRMG